MTEYEEDFPEPYSYTEDGTPVYATADGLMDADGVEYEIEDDQPDWPTEADIAAEADRYRDAVVGQREQLERELDRSLTPRETADLAGSLLGQIERGEPIDVGLAHMDVGQHFDLDKTSDRREYMNERLKSAAEPEAVAPLPLEATPSERQEWLQARMAGAPLVDLEPEE